MRSRVIDSSRALLAAVLLSTASLGACIIGPKQDDPESSLTGGGPSDSAGIDAGAALDDDTGTSDKSDATVADTTAPATDTGARIDGASDGSTLDAPGDAASDASDDAADTSDATDTSDALEGG